MSLGVLFGEKKKGGKGKLGIIVREEEKNGKAKINNSCLCGVFDVDG